MFVQVSRLYISSSSLRWAFISTKPRHTGLERSAVREPVPCLPLLNWSSFFLTDKRAPWWGVFLSSWHSVLQSLSASAMVQIFHYLLISVISSFHMFSIDPICAFFAKPNFLLFPQTLMKAQNPLKVTSLIYSKTRMYFQQIWQYDAFKPHECPPTLYFISNLDIHWSVVVPDLFVPRSRANSFIIPRRGYTYSPPRGVSYNRYNFMRWKTRPQTSRAGQTEVHTCIHKALIDKDTQ